MLNSTFNWSSQLENKNKNSSKHQSAFNKSPSGRPCHVHHVTCTFSVRPGSVLLLLDLPDNSQIESAGSWASVRWAEQASSDITKEQQQQPQTSDQMFSPIKKLQRYENNNLWVIYTQKCWVPSQSNAKGYGAFLYSTVHTWAQIPAHSCDTPVHSCVSRCFRCGAAFITGGFRWRFHNNRRCKVATRQRRGAEVSSSGTDVKNPKPHHAWDSSFYLWSMF